MFEIGNSLHEARVRRSIELSEVELATKIRVKYLRALEDERFELLPSETYVKGFLRTYADYLGLDGQLYVDEYNSRFVVGEELEARPRRSTVRPERRTRRLETGIVLLALAVVGIVTLVVISAWQTAGGGSGTNGNGKGARSGVTARSAKAKAKAKRTAGQSDSYLRIEAVSGSSYVAVHQGGPTGPLLFDNTIAKGSHEGFNRGKRFWLDLSSPENLRILVGGKPVPVSGYDRPVTLTVTPGGVRTN